MPKVVINSCFGGFKLSDQARQLLLDRGYTDEFIDDIEIWYKARHLDDLVEVVEQLGSAANGQCAELSVIDVEDLYIINDYDGYETIQTPTAIEWIDSRIQPTIEAPCDQG